MPQIGWFEIVIIVVVAILVIGPKDFPKVLKKDDKDERMKQICTRYVVDDDGTLKEFIDLPKRRGPRKSTARKAKQPESTDYKKNKLERELNELIEDIGLDNDDNLNSLPEPEFLPFKVIPCTDDKQYNTAAPNSTNDSTTLNTLTKNNISNITKNIKIKKTNLLGYRG